MGEKRRQFVGNIRGPRGVTFIPSVDENGDLSWSNDGNLPNPETVNVRPRNATTSADGMMSADDKAKLDGVASGAEVNVLEGVSVNGAAVAVSGKTAALTLDKSTVGLGNVDNTSDADKPISTAQRAALNLKVSTSAVGAANGVAELDANGIVLASQLPSYVDDALEYASVSAFPATGEAGKIYVAVDTNLAYRWSGSGYTEISPSLALGETSSTAYRGDRGKIAYDHSEHCQQLKKKAQTFGPQNLRFLCRLNRFPEPPDREVVDSAFRGNRKRAQYDEGGHWPW